MGKERILVTGGAGFIGSHLVDRLLAEGYAVRILDNLSEPTHRGIPAYLNKDAEFIRGDVSNPADLDKALNGVSGVFHEAAAGGFTTDIAVYAKSNAYGTALLMEKIAQGKHRVERVVVASSVGVYGEGAYRCQVHGDVFPAPREEKNLQCGIWEQRCPSCGQETAWKRTPETKPVSPEKVYSVSKYDQERTVLTVGRELGIHCAALRYFLTYGPRQSLRNPYTGICAIFSSQLVNGKGPRIFEDGKQVRDFVFVQDVVNANMLVCRDARAAGKVFNVGTGIPTSVLQIAETLGSYYGKEVPPRMSAEYRLGEARHIVADISRLQALGYEPAVHLREGLRRYTDWVAAQGNVQDYFSEVFASLQDGGVVRHAARAVLQ